MPHMTYEGTGVRYKDLDDFKRMAQAGAAQTDGNVVRLGVQVAHWSRGESVFLLDVGSHFIGHVEEGLGTKNRVDDAMYILDRRHSRYADIAQDTVAMIVNDMATLGIMPMSVAMHLALGDSKWLDDEHRASELVRGWKRACDLAGAVWGPGETPTLRDIVMPDAAVLSGSAVGRSIGRTVFNPDAIRAGDRIIFLESSGIHANGLTLARDIAHKLATVGENRGYGTRVPGTDRTYGSLLLDPTHIYCRAVEAAIRKGIDIHYGVNITGHGWRKLMRASQDLRYVIKQLPSRNPIFDFIQEHGDVEDREAYGNLNMGAGFALYMGEQAAWAFLELAEESNWPFRAYNAGHIEEGARSVVIDPKSFEFKSHELDLR
jgi:phosphoribosylformylglycinamidine cyclo-ligase